MAATQAENQQNEVNRDQVQQDQPPDLNNVVLQNGTEKNGGRIILGAENIVNTKTKSPGQNSLAVEMSQYRQESGAGPPIHNSSGNGEQNVNSAGIESSKLNSDGKSFQQNSEQSTGSDQNYSKGPDGNGQNMQGFSLGFPARGSYHPDQHGPGNPVQNSTESNLHQNHPFSQFNPQSMRHGFPTSKPMPGSQMVPPRPPSGGQNMNAPGGFPPHAQQQRFLSGQSISQPTGPTPTLNQLLQSPNPVHRYQNSCGDFGMQKSTEQVSGNIPYNQSWPPQRPLTSYSPQQVPSYRNQPPGGVARGSQSPYLGGQGSGPGSGVFSQQQQQQQPTSQPTAPLPQQPGNQQQQQYPSYPQRYPTPPGPGPVGRAAFSPHQLGSPYGQQPPPSQSQQMYGGPGGDQRSSWGQPQPGLPQASQQAPATPQPSPQPPPPPQPSPHPPPSPNQQHPPPQQSPQHSQQSSFPSRPQQPSTPNAHAPDAGDQNSNDSSSGPAPGTPNSQGMRPTPSPTGSTGSRSMSPAVGQQNIPMPPRPSSGQSDGSGPTRLSHSPMSSQSSYQQPLAPPGPHNMHGGYKMGVGGHPGMVPPGGQQMTPFSPQSQQYPQGNYNPRPQGQLSGVQYPGSGGHSQGYGVAPSQGPTPQQSPQPNSMASGQYPSRPIPNHVAHSQFGGYQGWGGPAVNQGQGPGMMSGKGPGPQNSGVTPQVVTNSPRAHTPPHYLKHHLQQKMGFGGSSSSPLQVGGYSSGPPMVPGPGPGPSSNSGPGMGPPGSNMHQHHSMGPPSSGSHHHPGMGPPPSGVGNSLSMGPPSSSVVSAPTSVPPSMGVVGNSSGPSLSNSHHDDPMPPPSASSHGPELGGSVGDLADNVIITTTSAVAGTTTNVTQSVPGSVTSVVTTGPDGAPIDEGSQQSTLSNASAASGEDPSCTPKSRKDGTVVGGYHSHPPTPQSTVASPGAASLTSMHEEYGDVNSPTSWPRTPASPVFNSHVHQDPYRAKKPDSLCKLYDMDESHERRMWLDKLLQFMDERGTPISACPTISKNPLDLFRLYLYVKERGGFMEVCKIVKSNRGQHHGYVRSSRRQPKQDTCGQLGGCRDSNFVTRVTKNKTWKDIAGLLGIGASSSAAYTLRKHYTKNLLAYECHFDRGGIDPQPIINQVEASSKKKGAKATSVPSPGSSNSQDSFPTASTGSMDGYGYGYPPGSTPDYNSPPMQRPATQTNAPSPHAGVPNPGVGDNISLSNPFDDVAPGHAQRPVPGPNSYGPSRPQGMQPGYQSQSGYSQYQEQYGQQYHPANTPNYRPMCPPYSTGEATERGYNQSTGGSGGSQPTASMPQGPPGQDPYNRYQPPGYAVNRAGYPPPTAPSSGPPGTPQQPGYPPQDNYYRQDQMPQSVSYPSSQLARQLVAPHSHAKSPYQQQGYASQQAGSSPSSPAGQMYPGGPQSKSMPPPAPQPRRHPDFAKEQQAYPGPYTQHRPAIYGWSNNSQFRGQFPPQGPGAVPQAPQQWAQGPPRPAGAQPSNNQWDQHRYPPAGQPPYQPPSQSQQQWMSNMPTPGVGQSSPLRPPMGPRPPFRPEGKPFPMPPPPGSKGQPPNTANASYPQTAPPKREIVFPPDSVEATTPVLYKRKRMTRGDVAPVEAWRLMMSLRSGLLAESCWALDVLNILLFDDSTVTYFGLAHLPGLLDVLLEHFRRSLADIFDNTPILPDMDRKWYRQAWPEVSDVDLGAVTQPMNPEDRTMLLESTTNYTLQSRKGDPVKVASREGDIFVLDSRKSWDVHGDVAEDCVGEPEPDTSSTNYIITCFQGEFGNVPFVRLLSNKCKDHQEEITLEEPIVSEDDRKNCDKKKRTKSLSDVLLRIKKEPGEANDILTREIREKVEKCEGKKDDDTQSCDFKKEKCESLEEQDCDVSANGVIVKKELSEEENNVATSNSSDCDKNETVDIDSKEKEEKIESPIGEIKDDGATNIKIRDPAGTLKRRRMSDYEDECYTRDEASLYLVTETQDAIARRCICLSNILRNLTFVPGNELEFAKNPTFLGLLGKLLLLHHEHPARTHKQRNYDREEDADFADSCSSLQGEAEWWWDFLHHVRENVLVTAANIAGHMDLGQYPEEISRPVLDGLLHWAVCPAAHGQDSFPTVGLNSSLSPQRLALEALCKLCVTDSNVDLVIATPPYSRLERLCAVLTKLLCRSEEQVLREFGVNLLHYLAAADSAVARTVALQSPCVSLLVAFIEQAEASALGVASQHGIGALRENPDSMGTSLDMLRRAAGTLLHLSRHPDNRPLFLQQEQRLLALVMSQILDQQVASILARVLFQCSRPS